MKKILRKKVILLGALSFISLMSAFAQTSLQNNNIVCAWVSEEDNNWEVVFTADNKCYQYYSGVRIETDAYTIADAASLCGQVNRVDSNATYLQLINQKDKISTCYVINHITETALAIHLSDKGEVFQFRKNPTGSFAFYSGFNDLSSSVTNYGGSAAFNIAFAPRNTLVSGKRYLVANISINCRPTSQRTMKCSVGNRTWSVVVNSNGNVYLTLVSGAAYSGEIRFGALNYPI